MTKIPLNQEKHPPPPRRGNYKYPFKEMEVGSSFDVPFTRKKDEDREKLARNVSSAITYAQYTLGRKIPGIKFTYATTDEYIRVWRTK